jgi:hypothetical protein
VGTSDGWCRRLYHDSNDRKVCMVVIDSGRVRVGSPCVAAQKYTINMPCCGQKRTSERIRKSEEAAPALEKAVRVRGRFRGAFHTSGRA